MYAKQGLISRKRHKIEV